MSAQRRPGSWRIGDWVADPTDDTLSRGAEVSKLEPRMMPTAPSPGRTSASRRRQDQFFIDVFLGRVSSWGPPPSIRRSHSLRKVLGDTGEKPTYIETVARKGYRLIAPVQAPQSEVSPPADAPPVQRMAIGWGIGIALVAANAAAAGLLWRHRLQSVRQPTSIAVLPFLDLTDGKTQQPFCDGVTEELSNWLSHNPDPARGGAQLGFCVSRPADRRARDRSCAFSRND